MQFKGTQDAEQNQFQNLVVHQGSAFPGSPVVGQLYERTDLTPKKVYIFLGVGVPGTTSGWFDLTHAYYAP